MKLHLNLNVYAIVFAVTITTNLGALCAQGDVKAFTEPYRSVSIAAPEMGTLAHLAVEEGQRIFEGDLLANLNEDVLKASLAVAQETIEAEGAIKSAKAELRMQQQRFTKILGLQERRHASQTEVDRAKAQLEIAEAKVESVEDELNVRQLEMKRIEAQLEQRRLRAPIDGVVTHIFKEVGEFVSATDSKVVKVVQLNPLRAIFSVPQNQTGKLKVNKSVTVQIGEQEIQGVVEFVSPTADAQSGTCRVKIKIDNSYNQLASGVACYLKGFKAGGGPQYTSRPDTLSLKTRK